MEKILRDINKNEVLKYLGYKGGKIDESTFTMINDAMEKVLETAVPRYTYKVLDIEKTDGIILKGTMFVPQGEDIAELLSSCEKCVMMAATLGVEFEIMLRKAQITDMAKAVTLDSCGSSAIENICNNVEKIIEDKWGKEGWFLTDRFSPGYGDMPIEQQRDFCMVLETPKKIGINVNAGGMLVPSKSVTAIIGLSKTQQAKRKKGCEYCNNFMNCQFRKEDRTCD
ncbi:MAG: methionine synthase [Lachnospiraceae bacterium]|nr:methionine synthase [Lachnospiraceae bacterium]